MTLVRIIAVCALAYLLGFALFMVALPQPLDNYRTDAIVVPTGGKGRIARGLELLQGGAARRMLITGAAPDVRPVELAVRYRAPRKLFTCCIDLGYEAVDTRSNAEETAQWVRAYRYASVRLVTSDWHLPRAKMELTHALGSGVEVVGDAVPSHPSFTMLVVEYNKFIVRRVALWTGVGP